MGDYPIRQIILHTRILVGCFSWELNPGVFGSSWLKASATWGDHIGWSPPWWGGGPCPLSHYALAFALQLRKSTENLSHGSRAAGGCSLRRLDCFCGTASTGLLDVRSPRFPRWLQSALGRRRCLPSCRTKWVPASVNFGSKLSVSALTWSAKNGIPKSSWICLLPTYQGALVAMRRHLDCSTCSFLTWLLAGDLQIGHA
jgi:hypothetical protein